MATYGGAAYGTVPYAGASIVGGGPNVTINGGLWPQMVIEIAPGYGPLQANPVWVDITADVRHVQIRRGRQHELSRFEAGTARIVVDNRAGTYYPWGSTYPNQLTAGLPLRVRAIYGSQPWPLYYGFVESVRPNWASVNENDVTFDCKDLLKFLALKKTASVTSYSPVVLVDAPVGYWRCGDAGGSTIAADSSGFGHPAVVVYGTAGDVFFGADGAIVASTDTAFDCGDSHGSLVITGLSLTQSACSLEVWAKVRSLPTTGLVGVNTFAFIASLDFDGIGTDQQLVIDVDNTSLGIAPWTPFVHVDNGLGGLVDAQSQMQVRGVTGDVVDGVVFQAPAATAIARVSSGDWHHFVATLDGTNVRLYVDGVLQVTAGAVASAGLTRATFGGQSLDGLIDEAAVYNTVLTPAQVLNHYTIGSAPLAGQLTGARIGTILGLVPIPAALQSLDAGTTVMQAASNDIPNTPVLSSLQNTSDTELGFLFVSATGSVTFYDRTHTSRSPFNAAAITMGSNTAGGEEPYLIESVDAQRDDLDTYNEIVVTPKDLGDQIVSDSASATAYGTRTLRQSNLLMSNPSDALGRANFLLNEYKTPLDRVRSFMFQPISDPNVLFPAALGFDLLTRIRFIARSADASAAVLDQLALIEGIEHTIDLAQVKWEVTWRLSTTDAVLVGIFNVSAFNQCVFGY